MNVYEKVKILLIKHNRKFEEKIKKDEKSIYFDTADNSFIIVYISTLPNSRTTITDFWDKDDIGKFKTRRMSFKELKLEYF